MTRLYLQRRDPRAALMTPALRYDITRDRWVLTLDKRDAGDPEVTYCMLIRYAWNGETWNDYRFIKWDMGDEIECCTSDQFKDRIRSIADHEGNEVADAWALHANIAILPDDHPVFRLRDLWEAMLLLRVFDPSVNLRDEQPFAPMSREGEAAVAAARAATLLRNQEEMARQIEDEAAGFHVLEVNARAREEWMPPGLDLADGWYWVHAGHQAYPRTDQGPFATEADARADAVRNIVNAEQEASA